MHKRGNRTDKQKYEETFNLTSNQIITNQNNNTLLLTYQTSKHLPGDNVPRARTQFDPAPLGTAAQAQDAQPSPSH